jgi:hypothetical protein
MLDFDVGSARHGEAMLLDDRDAELVEPLLDS